MCGRGGVAGDVTVTSEVQAGGRCKVGRVVYRLFDVEWGGRERTRSSEQGLIPWKRRKECKEG